MAAFALTGARIFTANAWLDDHAVIVSGDRIADIVAAADIPAGLPEIRLDGGILSPGFIDAQVNGGGGVLFNEAPTLETLRTMAAAFARFGTTALLPTFITDTTERRAQAIEAVNEAIAAGVAGIIGLHLEGPFIAPTRKGAHAADLVRVATADDIDALTRTGLATLVVTLAPECIAPELISRFAAAGVIVSLGHTEAGFIEATAAARAGARGVTHLFNAMSPLGHREPGMVGAALLDGGLWTGIIADGVHVHPAVLKLALAAKKGPAKPFLVTDAMPPAAGGGGTFRLNGREISRNGDILTLADGTIAGSNLTMDAALRYTVEKLGVTLEEALRMASLYPAMFLGLDAARGRIAAGYRADLVHLGPDLAVRATYIGGMKNRD